MARRTKEEAEQTRAQILVAARRVFHERGVSHTTLEHIAHAAGVTRGAIYWHFANKRELLQALCDDVTIPFIDRLDYTLLQDCGTDALTRIRNFMTQLVQSLDDERLRTVMEILEFKCEFVGERSEDLRDWATHSQELIAKLERTYAQAQDQGMLRADISPHCAALHTKCFLSGLMRMRLMGLPDLSSTGQLCALIDAHVRSQTCPIRSQ